MSESCKEVDRRWWASRGRAKTLAASIAVLALAYVGSAASQTTAPAAKPAGTPPSNSAPINEPPPDAGQSSSSYLIGPGDSIQIFVWRNPELSVTVPVRPDGKVSTPLVEDMVAVGKTPSALARDIERVLAEYVRSPQVNVIVANAQNAFNQIKVIGQVAQPKSVAYREGMTALDAMLDVGGLTAFAAGNRAKILRKDASGVQYEIKLKLESLLKKGRAADNPLLKPGDVIIVPEALF